MKNSCQGCKRYWNHLHGKVTRFVRQMGKSSRHCMVIPERFANHFAGKMSRTVKLEGPNGILYDVGVTEHRNRKVLQSGWEVFVDANDIVEKDSMMFRYRGSSRFKVAVFDSSGCEKTVSCFGIGSTMSDQEPITNSTEMSGSSSDRNTHSSMGRQSDGCQSESSGHCRKLAWIDAASSPSEDLPGEDSPYEHESSGSDDHTLPKMISTAHVKEEQYSDASGRSDGYQSGSSSHSGSTRKTAVVSTPSAESGEASFSEYDSFHSDDIPGPSKDKYVLSSRSSLADAQKEKIDMLLQDIQSRTLAFVAIMRKSNVQPLYPSLIIAKKYAVAHFPHESAYGILQRPGESKKWHPRFYKSNGGSIHKIRGEWFDFVCDNHVEEGDICIFVPAKGGGRFTFTVHLLPKESNAHEGPFVSPYIISQRSCLSPLQLSIVQDKAQAIQLEAPLYVTIMNKTNAGVNGHCMLEFGTKYATVYLPKAGQTILLQHRRKIWHTNMRIWDGRRRVLDGGWRKFVSDNHLRLGDMCVFELKKNRKKLTMIVHIITSDQC